MCDLFFNILLLFGVVCANLHPLDCGGIVNHLLLHYPGAYELWSMIFVLFGLCGLCQKGRRISSIVGTEGWVELEVTQFGAQFPIVFCDTYSAKRNARTFKRWEKSVHELKSFFFSNLYLSGWMNPLYVFDTMFEMLDACSCILHIHPM